MDEQVRAFQAMTLEEKEANLRERGKQWHRHLPKMRSLEEAVPLKQLGKGGPFVEVVEYEFCKLCNEVPTLAMGKNPKPKEDNK